MKILDVPQSGSMAGTTSSHNRFGQYRRSRSTPTNPSSSAQALVRARIQDNSAAWRTLTSAQRAAWDALGSTIVRQDSLGQTYTLTGFQAYMLVNQNNMNAGNAVVSTAPVLAIPDPLETMTITLAVATFSVAYTVTPLVAGARLFFFASPPRSAGRAYENDLRLIGVTAAAAASPYNVLSAYTARFGAPPAGARVFMSGVVYLAGFTSAPLLTSAVVVP